MQVKGAGFQDPVFGPDLLQGEAEQILIVGLEFHMASGSQNLLVPGQKVPGGQAPFGVAVFGPGVGKIQVDPPHFSRGKN